jgi:hypothetical protein
MSPELDAASSIAVRALLRWPRLYGHRFLGIYWRFWNDAGEATVEWPYKFARAVPAYRWKIRDGQLFYITYVWPWRFGWQSSQMYETFFIGPFYLLWTWA